MANQYVGAKSDEEVFVENSSHPRHRVKERLIKFKMIPYVCVCGMIDEWQGKPIVLELDHINGVNNDNRLGNLRFLCPNCHSQQPTNSAKNRVYQKQKQKSMDYDAAGVADCLSSS